MSTKAAVMFTVAWLVVVLGTGFLGVWYVHEHPVRGVADEQRAQQLGSGLGTVAGLGCGGIWAFWFFKRKARRSPGRRPRNR